MGSDFFVAADENVCLSERISCMVHESNEDVQKAAGVLLSGTGVSLLDAARLALELQEAVHAVCAQDRSSMALCRHVIRLGAEAYAAESRTVSFRVAVEQSLKSRSGRRGRTLLEITQCCRRVLRTCPELADMPVRRIGSDFCRELIYQAYTTPTTQRKARCLLHGIFEFCVRRGWCAVNPLVAVDVPRVREKPVNPLTIEEVRRLLSVARTPKHLPCAAAVGLMLWAGIRPTELTRLRWGDIRVDDRVVTVEACHSKTGGARQVTLYPVLIRWLRVVAPFRLPQAHIVPRAWLRRWRMLRKEAGFTEWMPDALRHTFASYHLKHFGDYKALQIDMGHGDTQLLRTRYLGMRGITSAGAAEFWGVSRRASRRIVEE